MITFYSTNCPKCKVLSTKLDQAGVKYNINTDSWYPIVFSKEQIGKDNIDIIPVPVPRSKTLESFFISFAKSDNKTASIPKQKPFLF